MIESDIGLDEFIERCKLHGQRITQRRGDCKVWIWNEKGFYEFVTKDAYELTISSLDQ